MNFWKEKTRNFHVSSIIKIKTLSERDNKLSEIKKISFLIEWFFNLYSKYKIFSDALKNSFLDRKQIKFQNILKDWKKLQ